MWQSGSFRLREADIHLHLMKKLERVELYFHALRHYGVVFN
jgi:hypothetical protein